LCKVTGNCPHGQVLLAVDFPALRTRRQPPTRSWSRSVSTRLSLTGRAARLRTARSAIPALDRSRTPQRGGESKGRDERGAVEASVLARCHSARAASTLHRGHGRPGAGGSAEHHRAMDHVNWSRYVYRSSAIYRSTKSPPPHIVKVLEAILKKTSRKQPRRPCAVASGETRVGRKILSRSTSLVRGFKSFGGDKTRHAGRGGNTYRVIPEGGKGQNPKRPKQHPAMPFTEVGCIMVERGATQIHSTARASSNDFFLHPHRDAIPARCCRQVGRWIRIRHQGPGRSPEVAHVGESK